MNRGLARGWLINYSRTGCQTTGLSKEQRERATLYWLVGLPVTASQLVTTEGRKATDGMADMRPCPTHVPSLLPLSVVTSSKVTTLCLGRKKPASGGPLMPTSGQRFTGGRQFSRR